MIQQLYVKGKVDRMKEKNEQIKLKKGTQKHLHLLSCPDNISMLTDNARKHTHTHSRVHTYIEQSIGVQLL